MDTELKQSTTSRARAVLWVGLVLVLFAAVSVAAYRAPTPDGTSAVGQPFTPPAAQPSGSTESPPPESPPPGSPYPLVGAQFQGTWSNYTNAGRRQLLDKLVAMGIRTVRIGVSWAMIQPDRPTSGDPGWNWSWGIPRVDSVIAMARARGLIVNATFGRTPSWANGGAGESTAPTDLADWRRAVRFVAHRYQGKVSSWEIWNEPNLDKFFTGASPEAYTKVLCAAYPVIHSMAPQTPVVFGGVNGNDWEYISQAYADGAKGCFDVLAVHPYQRWGYSPEDPAPGPESWYFPNVTMVRAIEEHYGDLKPIWFTELGWSTHANAPGLPDYERGVTEQQQADYLVQTLELTKERYPYVERVYIYQARDETDFSVENNNFGLFTTSLQPKPAVGAIRDYLRRQ